MTADQGDGVSVPITDPPAPGTDAFDDWLGDVLSEMTVAEKAGQCVGVWAGQLHEYLSVDDVEDLLDSHHFGAVSPFGWAGAAATDPIEAAEAANRLQRHAVEETRLGIPLFVPVDAVHGHAYVHGTTVFPNGLGLAATFSPERAETAGEVTAREARATGATTNYGPTCDVARDPRWGRTFETFGESPRLVADLAAAAVRGLQGASLDSDETVAATAKHFPAYAGPERGEDTAPVEATGSTRRRTYYPPFRAVVDEGVASVMPCYNSIDDDPVHGSPRFLRDLLRDDFGFEGFVASDWNGVRMLTDDHRITPDLSGAVREAYAAGVDVASVGGTSHQEALTELVRDGDLSESILDEHVRRVLRAKVELGLFDDPLVDAERVEEHVGREVDRERARDAARTSLTLLRNDGVLPLDGDEDLLVTGPNADDAAATLGGWSVPNPRDEDVTTVLDGLRAASDGSVTHVETPRGDLADDASPTDDEDALDDAVAAAADADVAVAVCGEGWYIHEFGPHAITGSDTEDFPNRASLSLPDVQTDLLRSLHETGTPTVLVLVTGRPHTVEWAAEHLSGVVMAYYPGSEGGTAVADVLFGADPGGHLPMSVPRSEGHLPVVHDHRPNPAPIGPDEHLPSYDPRYAFGHGLSYADFSLSSLSLSDPTFDAAESLSVTVDVHNEADRAGETVVQAYLEPTWTRRVRPVRELVAYERVSLSGGASTTVEFDLNEADLGDSAAVAPGEAPGLVPGEYDVAVGTSSTDLPLSASFEVPERETD